MDNRHSFVYQTFAPVYRQPIAQGPKFPLRSPLTISLEKCLIFFFTLFSFEKLD